GGRLAGGGGPPPFRSDPSRRTGGARRPPARNRIRSGNRGRGRARQRGVDPMTAGGSGLADASRIVLKIGSALLVDEASGQLRRAWLDALADDVAGCLGREQEVVIVSSGAIALGRRQLGLGDGALKLEESQAAAASGQIRLAHAWQEALARHGITVAQILVTLGDTEERRRYLNARSTIATLLRLGAVPVINENDTVATEEIRYGDNARLAARVAQMASADTLILFSDIDGLYTADPRSCPDAGFQIGRASCRERGQGSGVAGAV